MSASTQEHRNYGTTTPPGEKSTENDAGKSDPALSDSDSEDENATAGVKAIEGISQAWTARWLFVAYFGVVLLTNVVSLEQNTTFTVSSIALSSFQEHSLLPTIGIVQSVMLSVVKPPMAKIADVFGRLESFSISVFLYTLGYIQQAAASNFKAFAAAQIFYSAGSTGVQILVQIFVADTTDLLWRAFYSTVPDIPFLWTTWAGPEIAGALSYGLWRWAYGIWAICLPISFLPLLISLYVNKRKAKKLGILPRSPYQGYTVMQIMESLWFELDIFGLLLYSAFVCLILIPLTLGASAGWDNPSIIAMFVVGGVCLIAFPLWERSEQAPRYLWSSFTCFTQRKSTMKPKPFFPADMFRSRTVLVGGTIGFLYFMAFYLSCYPYFFSYLVVVNGESQAAAGIITRIFNFASTATSLVVSGIIYWTAHYKYFVTFGSMIYATGIGLMIAYRNQAASTATLVGIQICIGIGGGMLNVPAQLGVQASVSHQEVAAATAVFLTLVEVGGAVGNAVSGAIWTSNLLPKLEKYLPPETRDQASTIYGDFTIAGNYTTYPLGTPTRSAINRSYEETMRIILIVGTCVAAVIIPLSLLMENYKLDKMDQKVKGRVIGGSKDTDGMPEEVRERTASVANPAFTVEEDVQPKSRWPWKRR